MKIIFIDFDGVLNSNQYMESERFKTETLGMADNEIMLLWQHTLIDPVALQALNKLFDQTGGAVAVASTTWRKKYSSQELTDMCRERGATFDFVDSTPNIYQTKMSQYVTRGDEIQAYLDSLLSKPSNILILDDRRDMGKLKDYHFCTDEEYGFTESDINKAIDIFNKDYK